MSCEKRWKANRSATLKIRGGATGTGTGNKPERVR